MTDWLFTLACGLIAVPFYVAGINHLRNFRDVKAMLAGKGWPFPGPVLAVASMFEIIAASALVAGAYRPWAAGGLILFTLAATFLLLDFWNAKGPERQTLQGMFLLNVAVLGGLGLVLGLSL